MSLVVKPHIDTPLIYPKMVHYRKSLKYDTKVHFQQVEEDFPNLESINFPPHNLKLGFHERDIKKSAFVPAFVPRRKELYQVLLTTNTAAKLQGIRSQPHMSQMKRAQPASWT